MTEERNVAATAGPDEPQAADAQAAPDAKQPSRQRGGRKWPVVAGVVAAVLVVAGIGFWTWHEQPSFCAAICHTPMDEYLAVYDQEDGAPGVDKWGNEVPNTHAMLAVSHRAEGETCLGCHEPTLSEQIGEGLAWVAGDYDYPLNEANLTQLTAASGKDNDAFCLNEACHANDDGSVMTRADLEAKTAHLARNPHEAHHQELQCSTCHKAHRASVMYCTECHGDAEVPDGWLTVAADRKLSR